MPWGLRFSPGKNQQFFRCWKEITWKPWKQQMSFWLSSSKKWLRCVKWLCQLCNITGIVWSFLSDPLQDSCEVTQGLLYVPRRVFNITIPGSKWCWSTCSLWGLRGHIANPIKVEIYLPKWLRLIRDLFDEFSIISQTSHIQNNLPGYIHEKGWLKSGTSWYGLDQVWKKYWCVFI